MTPRPLFRSEALDAQRQQWLGEVRLARPLSLRWVTIGAVLLALVAGTFLSVAEYTRRTPAQGVLVPDRGLIRVLPPLAGTVVEAPLREGETVEAGEVLFVLAVQQALPEAAVQAQVQRSLAVREASLREALIQQQRLLQTQQAALQRRLQALDSELAQLDAEATLQQQRLTLARQALARLESLQAENFVSPAQTQAKGEEVLALQAASQGLARLRAALERERAEIDGERDALPELAAGAVSALERELAQLDRETAESELGERRMVVRAPQAGTVAAVLTEPGASVGLGQALATVVPAGSTLQAHLYLPSRAMGFVQSGQTVRLRYEAFPYARYGHRPGRVLQISRSPLTAADSAALALPALPAGGEPLFRVTVALEPDGNQPPLPLAAGMRLQADVMLESRRLVAWLFEPLIGWRERA